MPYGPAPELVKPEKVGEPLSFGVHYTLGPLIVYEEESLLQRYKDSLARLLETVVAQEKQDRPAPLCIDGHAYHRKRRSR